MPSDYVFYSIHNRSLRLGAAEPKMPNAESTEFDPTPKSYFITD
jgi:hypothetical protein